MRVKLLAIITSFLTMSVVISSCLDSDTNLEYSSDATIRAFALDTVRGVDYEFTIDQLQRIIYNRDSMPLGADTIIDSIKIKTLDVNWAVTTGAKDTTLNIDNYQNLLPAMNKSGEEGIKLKVHAADAVTTRLYTLQIRVHQQDPDTLVWHDMQKSSAIFDTKVNNGTQKAIVFNNELWIYTSYNNAYKTSVEEGRYAWSTAIAVAGLPEDTQLKSLKAFGNKLYLVTASGDVYTTTNGAQWLRSGTLSQDIVTLVATMDASEASHTQATLIGIQKDQESGINYFCTTTDEATWTRGEQVPEGFPTENIYHTSLPTANGTNKIVIMGEQAVNQKATIPWFTTNGKGWASLENNAYDSHCPGMHNPFLAYYGDKLYSFGGKFDAIYGSVTGIEWRKTEKKFLLPAEFKDKGNYTATIDNNHFIWIIFGGNGTKNEVWRGRLNRLGFKEQ